MEDLKPFDYYIAGFIDGEGCIDIRYRRTNGGKYQRFELRVTVSQVDIRPLVAIKESYGGSISPRRNNAIHYWVLSGSAAYKMLVKIKDCLIVKKDEAQVAINFYELVTSNKETRHATGKRYIQKESDAVVSKKIAFFNEIRQIRLEKGVKSKARKTHTFLTGAA